jgi:hypothetical protein
MFFYYYLKKEGEIKTTMASFTFLANIIAFMSEI